MIPFLFVFKFKPNFENLKEPLILFNILFLSLGASALCFVTWNFSVKLLGAMKTTVYIYMVPAITVITSIIILKEKITWTSSLGVFFIIIGLILSEMRNRKTILGSKKS